MFLKSFPQLLFPQSGIFAYQEKLNRLFHSILIFLNLFIYIIYECPLLIGIIVLHFKNLKILHFFMGYTSTELDNLIMYFLIFELYCWR